MRHLLLLLLFSVPVLLTAQQRAPEYIDVVYLKGGDEVQGTVLEYVYGEKVVLVRENGDLSEYKWENIRRVNFRLDKSRLRTIWEKKRAQQRNEAGTTGGTETVLEEFRPSRNFQHQVTGAVGFGRSTNTRFNFNTTTIGGAFAYHLVKEVGRLNVGAGVDVSLMSNERSENVLAATLQVEYPIGFKGKHFQPLIRFEAGPSIPFGNSGNGEEITKRQLSILYQPSIGVLINPRKGQWGGLIFDVGYRFLDSKFTITTSNLDELQRSVSYRRLVLRAGIRF